MKSIHSFQIIGYPGIEQDYLTKDRSLCMIPVIDRSQTPQPSTNYLRYCHKRGPNIAGGRMKSCFEQNLLDQPAKKVWTYNHIIKTL